MRVGEARGKQSRRRRDWPAPAVVYYAIALALYRQGSYREVLRCKTPNLVRQEFYGFLLAHFAIRGLLQEAAWQADLDPDRLSFLPAESSGR